MDYITESQALEPIPPSTNRELSNSHNQRLWIILLLILLVLGISIYFLFTWPHNNLLQKGSGNSMNSNLNTTNTSTKNTPEAVIAKVGKEYIYQNELDTELTNYPVINKSDARKQLLQKIAKDSISLQAGQAENLIQLDSTTFNSSHIE